MSRLWSDIAVWCGPTTQQGGLMREQRGMVVHIAEGSYEGTISWQKKPGTNVSSHFVTAGPSDALDGQIAQVVPTTVTAWTQQNGNGKWLSVENSGFSPHGLSAAQVEANAILYARGMRELGWPAQLASSPSDRGLAFHGLACVTVAGQKAPWTLPNTSGEVWGHCECPGSGVIAQLPAILARAVEINGGGGEADDMTMLFQSEGESRVWASDGLRRRALFASAYVRNALTNAGAGPVNILTKADAAAIPLTPAAYLDAVAGPEDVMGGGGTPVDHAHATASSTVAGQTGPVIASE